MDPNDLDKITNSSIAPLRRGLRAGASSHRQDVQVEVLPQYYGKQKKDPSRRTPKSLLSQAHLDSRTDPPSTQSGCVRQSGVDGEQLGSHAGITHLYGAATISVDIDYPPSLYRTGDRTRQGMGEEKAGVGTGCRNVIESGGKEGYPTSPHSEQTPQLRNVFSIGMRSMLKLGNCRGTCSKCITQSELEREALLSPLLLGDGKSPCRKFPPPFLSL